MNTPETTEINENTQKDTDEVGQYIDFKENTKTEDEQLKAQELFQSLKKKLMKVYKQRKGDKVSLCPQMLRELYDLIIYEFTDVEKASIAIYELQTYLIEVSVYPKDYYQGMRFEVFFNWLMTSIRYDPKLWIKSSPIYKKVFE